MGRDSTQHKLTRMNCSTWRAPFRTVHVEPEPWLRRTAMLAGLPRDDRMRWHSIWPAPEARQVQNNHPGHLPRRSRLKRRCPKVGVPPMAIRQTRCAIYQPDGPRQDLAGVCSGSSGPSQSYSIYKYVCLAFW